MKDTPMHSRLIRCLMGALLTVIATMAPAQTAQQATPQTLQAVIAASDGGTIALVPGNYGSLSLRNLQATASAPRSAVAPLTATTPVALARRATALAPATACGLIAAQISRCKIARSLAFCAAWW